MVHDSLKKIGVMRDRYPPPPFATLANALPSVNTAAVFLSHTQSSSGPLKAQEA